MTQRTPSPYANLNKLIATPASSVPAKPHADPPPSTPERAPSKLGNKETSLQPGQEAAASPTPPATTPLPITPDPPHKQSLTRKQTYEFTRSELEFLTAVKFQLRHLGVTKNEIVQTGLELVAKDYAANQTQSYLVRKFALRQTEDEFV